MLDTVAKPGRPTVSHSNPGLSHLLRGVIKQTQVRGRSGFDPETVGQGWGSPDRVEGRTPSLGEAGGEEGDHRFWGKPRSTELVLGSGQRDVTTLVLV
jgi:hypothetical protein